jgi:hypothetical protein
MGGETGRGSAPLPARANTSLEQAKIDRYDDMMARSPIGIATALLLLWAGWIDAQEASEADPTASCPTTITHSSSQEITLGNSISCQSGPPGFFHFDTSYWRAFNMATFSSSQAYRVTSVSFGIETAHSETGAGQPLMVRLYSNAGGAFPGGNRTTLASTSVTVLDQTQTIFTVPLAVTVPAGTSELVMEVFAPSGQDAGNAFFIGSNTATQTASSYVSAATCGNSTPIDTAALGQPNMHIVFNVNGSCSSGTPAKALNIATRLRVELGDNAMIGGFIINGSGSKALILRGIGPSLVNSGISDALGDPVLSLRGSNGAIIRQNDNWQEDAAQAALINGAGLAPQDPRESGIAATLSPGAYTAVLTGTNQTTGVGLVEIYDTNFSANAQLGNISTRGLVQTGTNVMIGGFILGGTTGSARVVLRGIGPTLSQSGLSNVLANPTLELHNSNGTTLASNDNWQDDPVSAAALSANGFALQNSLESGIFITLSPGAFTAILAGKNGGTGIGLVEVYNLQ